MNPQLANPTIEEIQQCNHELESAFQDFDIKIKKLVLVHDYTYGLRKFETKVIISIYFISTMVFCIFAALIFLVDVDIRASLSLWGQIGFSSILGGMIVGFWLVARSVKIFSAFLLRRDIKSLTKKGVRQVTNIENYLEISQIGGDGKKYISTILKKLEDTKEGFKEIDELFNYYPRALSIPILSISSLLAAILAINPVYQLISSISINYIQTIITSVIIIALIGLLYYVACNRGKEDIIHYFEVDESAKKLEAALKRINTLIIGTDLIEVFSNRLLFLRKT